MTTLTELAPASLETVRGGLSLELRQRAFATANQRWMDHLDYNSPKADKFLRQMSIFGR